MNILIREKQYVYYIQKAFEFDDSVPKRKLGDLIDVCMCKRIKKEQTNKYEGVPFYKNGTLGKTADSFISPELYASYREKYDFPREGEVMLSTAGTVGRTVKYDGKPAYFQDSNVVWLKNDEKIVTNEYLYWFCETMPWKLPSRSTIKHLHNDMIRNAIIPTPSIKDQMLICEYASSLRRLFPDIKDTVSKEKRARLSQYEYYRDKLLTFKEA